MNTILRWPEGKPLGEALGEAGMNFPVRLVPPQYNGQNVRNYNLVVRQDYDVPIGIVRDRYCPRDYSSSFSVLQEFPELKIKVAGSLKNGALGFIQASAGIVTPDKFEEEGMEFFLTLLTSHDGSRPFTAFWSPVRLACFNQLRRAVSGAENLWKVRHTAGYELRLATVTGALHGSEFVMREYKSLAEELLSASFDDEGMTELANHITGYDPTIEEKQTRALHQAEEIVRNYKEANSESIRGSKWGAYQAVTAWIDRGKPVRGFQDVQEERVLQFQNSVFRNGDELREKALQFLGG